MNKTNMRGESIVDGIGSCARDVCCEIDTDLT